MAVSDNDLELLDAYLDDALDPADVDALRARLAGDAELVAALEQVRGERTMRRGYFAALEPDDAAVATLVKNVRGASVAAERRRPALWIGPARFAVAAAACVAIGFFSRGLFDRPSPSNNGVAGKNGGTAHVEQVTSYEVKIRDESGRVVAVQRFDSFDKASEFAADLAKWQAGAERLAGGKFVVTSDRF